MTENQLTRIMFETIIILAVGLIGFMGLSIYNMRVIDQQHQLIQDMMQNPACTRPATGGNHG